MRFGFWFFELLLQIAESLQLRALIFADPALVDFVNGNRVEVVELFAAAPDDGNEVGLFEEVEMFGHGLAGHVEVLTKLGQGLPVGLIKDIEQFAPTGIGQGFENFIHDVQTICN